MPMRRLPKLSALRAFEAAARRGSFKDAAAEMSVTPGAISQQIKGLEAELGVDLFVRKTRAVVLTPAGEKVLPTLSQAFQNIRQVLDEVRPTSEPTLRISSTNALISNWLLPRLHRFTMEHPEVQVHIDSQGAVAGTPDRAADVDICYGPEPPQGMYAEVLHRELMLVVSNPLLLEKYQVASPDDLRRVPILYDTHFVQEGNVTSWEAWARHSGMPDAIDLTKAIRFEKAPGGQIVDAAIAGVGVGICGSLLVHAALADGRLVCPFGPVLESGNSYFLLCDEGREVEPHIRSFLKWARKEAAVLTTLNAMRDASTFESGVEKG